MDHGADRLFEALLGERRHEIQSWKPADIPRNPRAQPERRPISEPMIRIGVQHGI